MQKMQETQAKSQKGIGRRIAASRKKGGFSQEGPPTNVAFTAATWALSSGARKTSFWRRQIGSQQHSRSGSRSYIKEC